MITIKDGDNMNDFYSIAIDGPSGAGKSSQARAIAEKYGFIYVDTGAIYRTLGLAAYRRDISCKDEAAIMELLPTLSITMGYDSEGVQRMYLDGEDVSAAIRQPEISICASDVSAHSEVRAYLLEMQRKMARENNVVMDGRDIGTVVLPDAELKIFLTASAEARAMRRLAEHKSKGVEISFEQVLADIQYRDEQDSTRDAAPLAKADDAYLVDCSETDFEETKAVICAIIEERLNIKARN